MIKAENSLKVKPTVSQNSDGYNLLNQLEDRVNRALKFDNSAAGIGGKTAAEKTSVQDIRNYIAGISSTPFPGTLIQNTII